MYTIKRLSLLYLMFWVSRAKGHMKMGFVSGKERLLLLMNMGAFNGFLLAKKKKIIPICRKSAYSNRTLYVRSLSSYVYHLSRKKTT
jgi:hypothetical protein